MPIARAKHSDILAETAHAVPELALIAFVHAEDLAAGNNVRWGSPEDKLALAVARC
jgi:hypothetical protein